LAQLGTKGRELPAFDVLVTRALDAVRKNLVPGTSAVADCVDRYLAARKPGLSVKAYRSIRARLRHFARDFGTHAIQSITPQMITDWLQGLTRKCSGPEYGQKAGQAKASADSRNHYRAALITFFGHAFEQEWAPTNPAACVRRAIPDRPKAAVLTPTQAETLLMTACLTDPDVLPALALLIFAGLRVSEVPGIDLDELRSPNAKVIKVDSSKTGPRVVPICDALRAWLEFSPVKDANAWSGAVRDLRRRLTQLFRAAGCDVAIESPRYSYFHYQLEISKDVAGTAPLACALVMPIDVQSRPAQAYFSLTPKIATDECPDGPTCPTSTNE
jgi:site-specific recombinase XerC